jgi:hypothetical protein
MIRFEFWESKAESTELRVCKLAYLLGGEFPHRKNSMVIAATPYLPASTSPLFMYHLHSTNLMGKGCKKGIKVGDILRQAGRIRSQEFAYRSHANPP